MSNEPLTALVTGGSRGIGRAIALALAGQANHIAILYAGNREAAEQTVRELEAKGAKALAIQCDVSDAEKVRQAVKQAQDSLGPIRILVNNAGITRDGLSLRMGAEDFTRVIATNLNGAFHVIQACYRGLMKAGWGRIVNIGSVSGLMGNPGQANYSAAKAGLVGLTKTIARELAPRGVTCNLVCPGFIETDMTRQMNGETLAQALKAIPAGRIGQAEEVADTVAFLCGRNAGYITGAVLQVDGGMYM